MEWSNGEGEDGERKEGREKEENGRKVTMKGGLSSTSLKPRIRRMSYVNSSTYTYLLTL